MSDAGNVVALEIGGTHVSAACVDLAARALEPGTRRRTPLPTEGDRDELLATIVGTAEAAARGQGGRWSVAVPGPFDYERGVFRLRHKLAALYGVDLRGALARYAASVRFLNDADAFVLGEWWAGAARGHERVVGVTLGTGLGSAFLVGGRVVREGTGVPADGELYTQPFRGALVEETISRRALLARYGGEDGIDVEHVAARARDGDRRAREAFGDFARALAEFLAPWLTSFAPSCLVVGGSIAKSWDLIRPVLAPELSAVAEVTAAHNLEDAALLGAAQAAV